MMTEPIALEFRSLRCPVCEAYDLRSFGRNSARCASCHFLLGGGFLTTLRRITELPETRGSHACDCGHPEMRRLPDGIYRCPACGSEIMPVTATAHHEPDARSGAYWSGWLDGRYGEDVTFIENRRLEQWASAADRLEYYQGHRSGREARMDGNRLLGSF